MCKDLEDKIYTRQLIYMHFFIQASNGNRLYKKKRLIEGEIESGIYTSQYRDREGKPNSSLRERPIIKQT